MQYRPDIDGLRAIAVLSVFFYHLGFAGFGGGFVGVDVFFVISGYLITRIIVDELDAGHFTFTNFYLRRARRILPALFVTILVCFAIGAVVLAPEHLATLAASALAATVSLSNFYFTATAGYFDFAATSKPLLHTWSLSVEEQFYLVYPLAIFLVFRRFGKRALPAALVGCALLSLSLFLVFQFSHSLLAVGQDRAWAATFYLAPFRAFEFAIGALVLWVPALKERTGQLAEVLLLVGLIIIGWSVYSFSSRTLFPWAGALVPCLGAALTIYGGSATRIGLLLRNPISVRVGKVSYSLYLVHWPVIVFWQYCQGAPLSTGQATVAIVGCYLLAELMFAFVEQPFRGRQSYYYIRTFRAPAVACALVLLPLLLSAALDGWPWRLDKAGQQVAKHFTGLKSDIVGRIGCQISCEFGNPLGEKVLVVGDSNVDHYTKVLRSMGGDRYHFYLTYGASCFFGATIASRPIGDLARECVTANAKLRELLAAHTYKAIIISERWPGYQGDLYQDGDLLIVADLENLFAKMLLDIDRLYSGFSGPIVIIGHAPSSATGCYARPQLVQHGCLVPHNVGHEAFKKAFLSFRSHTNLNISLVSPDETICPNGQCRLTDDAGQLLYTDEIHFSIYGAALIVPAVLNAIEKQERPAAGSATYFPSKRE
jgi:peptidoglycan/LPS O-acetylase OafA/YrhL